MWFIHVHLGRVLIWRVLPGSLPVHTSRQGRNAMEQWDGRGEVAEGERVWVLQRARLELDCRCEVTRIRACAQYSIK
mgnify:FL=1